MSRRGAQAITTIEAIVRTDAGARAQRAWLDLEVVQCGYCQSGQIMSATALLQKTAEPDRRRHRRRDDRQRLPLRDVRADPATRSSTRRRRRRWP
jgi:aerobic-type carbon monoxide dehydrogenase small subunit (CoxS/CutS family)